MGVSLERIEKNRINGHKGGRPKGSKAAKTLEKEKTLEAFKQRVFRASSRLFTSQFQSAIGVTFVYRIDRLGKNKEIEKHILVEDPKEIETALNQIEAGENGGDNGYYYISVKEPDVRASSVLLDRAYGKPTESIEHSGRDGRPMIIKLD